MAKQGATSLQNMSLGSQVNLLQYGLWNFKHLHCFTWFHFNEHFAFEWRLPKQKQETDFSLQRTMPVGILAANASPGICS